MQTLDGHVIIFCEYTSMCECAQESVHTLLVHEQVWPHEVSTIVLCFPVLKQGLSLNLKPEARHVDQAGCPANELSESIHLLTPAWGLQSHSVVFHSFILYMGAVDPLSSPSACIALTLDYCVISQPFYSLYPKLKIVTLFYLIISILTL